jgi:hypothetical protein
MHKLTLKETEGAIENGQSRNTDTFRYCNTCLWLKVLVGIGIQDIRNKQTGLNIMRNVDAHDAF